MTRSKQETIPRPFRFQPETLAQLDALCEFHGGLNRTDVLRMLVSKAYRNTFGKNAPLPGPPPARPGPKPSGDAKSANRRNKKRA